MEQIRAINIHKSSGITDVSSRLIKDAMGSMQSEFLYLMNLSLITGCVPNQWKIATVIPIPKVKNSTKVTDLRPISLLPLPGKILEKFVHKDLMTYLIARNLLNDNQFGFRPGLSTSDAIATFLDEVGTHINSGQLTIATFIDFSKAFNTLDHGLLIQKLLDINISDNTYKWFKSYLTNRNRKLI